MSENAPTAPKCLEHHGKVARAGEFLVTANGDGHAHLNSKILARILECSDENWEAIVHNINAAHDADATLTAEVARLREALEAILHHTTERFAREQARRALGGGA